MLLIWKKNERRGHLGKMKSGALGDMTVCFLTNEGRKRSKGWISVISEEFININCVKWGFYYNDSDGSLHRD